MGDGIQQHLVRGPAHHIPVMLDEVLDCLSPVSGKLYIDGTYGAGGYTKALLDAGADVLAMDRDPTAVQSGLRLVEASNNKLKLIEGEFADMAGIAERSGISAVDGVVLDIGVSSMQVDESERGFSFQKDGPLDMRMAGAGVSAADVVNHVGQSDLTRIIGLLGEERRASRISHAIVRERQNEKITSTRQLAKIIEKVLPRKAKDRIHPATRTFQALRIFVNQELQQLATALFATEKLLKAGGRLVVVTFHSLEDRIAKLFFRDRGEAVQGSRHLPAGASLPAVFVQPDKGMIRASEAEALRNPRARSAKLRWGERTEAPARTNDDTLFGLPDLVSLSNFSELKG